MTMGTLVIAAVLRLCDRVASGLHVPAALCGHSAACKLWTLQQRL